MAQSNRESLGTGKITSLIYKMAGPTIIAQIITTFYNLVDTYFVSQLGTAATAAVGVNSNMERLITLVSTLIGGGAGSYIAILLGRKSDKEADQVLSTSTITGFAIGTVIMAAGIVWLSPIVDFLGATPDCKQYSMDYGKYVLYAAPFIITSAIINMVLRSEGASTFAMIGMGFGGILNCFLDPIFIFRLNLGVMGASIATAISKFISFAILLYPYLVKKTVVRLSFKDFRFVWTHIKSVVSIGMSVFMRTVINVIAMILLTRFAGRYSTELLAAISVAGRIMMFPFAIVLGFGMGFQPVEGYNWGAKKYDRVKEGFQFALKLSVLGGILLGAAIFFTARPLIGLFNKEANELIYTYGILTVRAESVVLVAHSFGMIVSMFFSGTGHSGAALFASMARQGYCFFPLLYLFPAWFGPEGLCFIQAGADLISLVVFVPLFFRARRIIREAENAGAAEKTQ